MLGVAAQRIAWLIRKPRNNADECHCAETRRDGAFRAICIVAPLARGACHGHRVASRISSRKASVAATRGLFRGSLAPTNARPQAHDVRREREFKHCRVSRECSQQRLLKVLAAAACRTTAAKLECTLCVDGALKSCGRSSKRQAGRSGL